MSFMSIAKPLGFKTQAKGEGRCVSALCLL
jgi:hypothetical protein